MKHESPMISVVIPTYNAALYLRDCLDSLLAQSCAAFEAICVNDGSTDTSLAILRDYEKKDQRIRVIDQKNGGYGKAMNVGIDAATGKYLAILEPDDKLPSKAYESLLLHTEKETIDIVKGICSFFTGEAGSEKYSEMKIKAPEGCIVPRKALRVFTLPMWTVTAIYRLDFLRVNNIRYNETPGASFQDIGFHFLTLALAESMRYTNAVTYYYRRDNPASSINSKGKVMAAANEWVHTYEELQKRKDLYRTVAAAYTYRWIESMLWHSTRVAPISRMELLRAFQNRIVELENELDFSMCSLSVQENVSLIKDNPATYVLYHTLGKDKKYPAAGAQAAQQNNRTAKYKYILLGITVFSINETENVRTYKVFGISIMKRKVLLG